MPARRAASWARCVPVSDATRPARLPKRRSWWWRIHQLAGLQLSLVLVVVLVTGTLASLSPEIDWLQNPAMRVTPQDRPMASWGRWLDGARAGAGIGPGGAANHARIERIERPIASRFAVEALAVSANGERRRIQVNPWTGAPLGTTSWSGARRLLRDLHRHLMLPGWIGLPLVAILSVPLLASLVTAFAVYKKWWRGFLRVPPGPRSIADRRRFIGDLHRWAGLWLIPFIAVAGLTSAWYLIEWAGLKPPDPTIFRPIAPAVIEGAALDRIVARGQAAMSDLTIRAITFPEDEEGQPAGGVRLSGDGAAWLVRDRANAVLFDARTETIVASVRGTNLTPGQRVGEAADPLHFGTWGGTATRWLWFAFGLVLSGLAITGVLIHAMRSARIPDAPQGLMQPTWTGMGRLALPVTATLCAGLGYLVATIVG